MTAAGGVTTRSRGALGAVVARRGKAGGRRKKNWTTSVGEHGFTVRIFEIHPGSRLYRSVWVPGRDGAPGREDKKSLGHSDRDLAVRQAYELIAHLRTAGDGMPQGEVTLGALRVRYVAGRAHARKKERTRVEDERKLERVVGFLGPTRRVVSLDEEAVLDYVDARRRGDPSLLHVRPRPPGMPPVNDRTIEADLVALHTMVRWGCVTKNAKGVTFLGSDPLRGVPFPRELNPRQPVLSEDDLEALLSAADAVHPLLRPALIVADGTGRRLSAWRQLRWQDIDFDREEHGAIHWPGETDKGGLAMWRPISARVRNALMGLRPTLARADTPVFPSPQAPGIPVAKRQLHAWLSKTYASARLVPDPGGMWHPVRRKWVGERRGYPLVDIAAAGGWKDERSLRSYMKEDAEMVRRVVLEPTHRLRRQNSTT